MTTIFTIITLLAFAAVARFLSPFVLNFGGFPGSLLAGEPGARSRQRFTSGVLVSTIGQSFCYLAFVAFIVRWTQHATNINGAFMVVWPVALMAALTPIWFDLIAARIENREAEYANPQVEALHLTVLITLIGFFAFALAPRLSSDLYGWLPYLR